MFRTNDPTHDWKFDYDKLVYWMKNKTLEAGLEFPEENFSLIDYSLLNPFNLEGWVGESKFYKNNPHKGSLVRWPILGMIFFLFIVKYNK